MNEHPWQIIIAERGFVFVGRVSRESDTLVIRDAALVRRYSINTLDGLGGLAERGPVKDNDVLDPQPTTRVHVLAMIASIDCTETPWNTWHAAREKSAKKR